jgi:hypothetical protein
MPFEAVVFGSPKTKGETTLPETIACGDLDGDVYLICWSKRVVGYIDAGLSMFSIATFVTTVVTSSGYLPRLSWVNGNHTRQDSCRRSLGQYLLRHATWKRMVHTLLLTAFGNF